MEVTRSETCMSLASMSACCGTVVTWPSHEPARVFILPKDCCAPDCAKATVESDIRTTDSQKRRDFTVFHSPAYSVASDPLELDRCTSSTVIFNYITRTHVKLFLLFLAAAVRIGQRAPGRLVRTAFTESEVRACRRGEWIDPGSSANPKLDPADYFSICPSLVG